MIGTFLHLWQWKVELWKSRPGHPMATEKISLTNPARFLRRSVPDWDLVEGSVATLLLDHHVYDPPIPLDEMLRAQHLTVQFGEFPSDQSDVAGFIRLPDRKIYVNAADAPRRQTFTIAHELGHWMLHRNLLKEHPELYRVLKRDGSTGTSQPLEQEANGFAARLLVPKPLLDRFWRRASVRPSPATLAQIFAVSEDVIRFRLKSEYRRSS